MCTYYNIVYEMFYYIFMKVGNMILNWNESENGNMSWEVDRMRKALIVDN